MIVPTVTAPSSSIDPPAKRITAIVTTPESSMTGKYRAEIRIVSMCAPYWPSLASVNRRIVAGSCRKAWTTRIPESPSWKEARVSPMLSRSRR